MDPVWQLILDHTFAVGTVVYAVGDIVLRLVALIVVPRNRRPNSALAWLLAIMIFPWVGFPLYLILGKAQLPRKRREKQKIVNRLMQARAHDIPDSELDPDSPSWLQSAVQLNRNLGAFPLTGNNSADLEIGYEESLARMAADIRGARESVNVLFYTMVLDEVSEDFFEALAEVAARGVTVRLLYDFLGTVTHVPQYRAMKRHLKEHGIEHYSMMPVKPFRDGAFQRPDLRNHRKILVVDGEIGWMGSQNIIARHYNRPANIRKGLKWQETMVRFMGPIVSEMNLLFAIDWYYESGEFLPEDQVVRPSPDTSGDLECQIVPSGPGFVLENNLMLFNQLFYSASRRIVAVSPYFVPEDSMIAALVTAAMRGVEVELFVSEIGDKAFVQRAQRSYYSPLLRAGVRIQLFEKPYILHAKHVTVDDSVTVIGSSNMDIRSFLLDMESSVMIGGTDFMEQMHEVENAYRDRSRELTLQEWEQRSFFTRTIDNLCRLLSAVA